MWFLTGFWHGASWNFIVWGLYYGVLLLLEKYILSPVLSRLPGPVTQLYSFFLVLLGWVPFFSPDLCSTLTFLGNMFGIGGSGILDSTGLYYLSGNILLLLICILSSTPLVWSLIKRFVIDRGRSALVPSAILYLLVLILCTASLVNATYNPFLYFRF